MIADGIDKKLHDELLEIPSQLLKRHVGRTHSITNNIMGGPQFQISYGEDSVINPDGSRIVGCVVVRGVDTPAYAQIADVLAGIARECYLADPTPVRVDSKRQIAYFELVQRGKQ